MSSHAAMPSTETASSTSYAMRTTSQRTKWSASSVMKLRTSCKRSIACAALVVKSRRHPKTRSKEEAVTRRRRVCSMACSIHSEAIQRVAVAKVQ